MKKFAILAAMLMLAASGRVAVAADTTPGDGAQTRAWLDLQKNNTGKAAARGLPGEAADRVYQRYLQSFARPIPDHFERDRISAEGQQR